VSGTVIGAVALALCLSFLGSGCDRVREGDLAARVSKLERRLTTTCACHPRKIEGLPIQRALRADLAAWIEAGKDDEEILWLAFDRYGRALLAVGVDDLEGLVHAALWITGFIAMAGFAALVGHLRRRPPEGQASGAPAASAG
jgi:hypothetical protein